MRFTQVAFALVTLHFTRYKDANAMYIHRADIPSHAYAKHISTGMNQSTEV